MNMKRLHMYLIMVTNALLRRKLRMFIALLAVAIGATIISGMITVYKEVPEQMGREFRAYGANLLLLPADGKERIEESEIAKAYQMMENHELVGKAPFLYERLRINESPVLVGGGLILKKSEKFALTGRSQVLFQKKERKRSSLEQSLPKSIKQRQVPLSYWKRGNQRRKRYSQCLVSSVPEARKNSSLTQTFPCFRDLQGKKA